jgi:hypothetical protein
MRRAAEGSKELRGEKTQRVHFAGCRAAPGEAWEYRRKACGAWGMGHGGGGRGTPLLQPPSPCLGFTGRNTALTIVRKILAMLQYSVGGNRRFFPPLAAC